MLRELLAVGLCARRFKLFLLKTEIKYAYENVLTVT